MRLTRRRVLSCLSIVALAAAAPAVSAPADYPDKPVRIVVPVAPGGATDILARQLGQHLAEVMKQPVIIENKPGGSGTIAAQYVINSAPDGYTLLLGAMDLASNPHLLPNLSFRPMHDLTPIAALTLGSLVLVINPAVIQVNTLQEFIDAAKANPGKFTFGSAGNGNVTHLFAEMFKRKAGVDILHVPYRGTGPALTDLQSGQIVMMIAGRASTLPLVKDGRLKALAMTGKEGHSTFPGVPTFYEAGLPIPETDLGAWTGIFGPPGMPEELVNKISQYINTVLVKDDFKANLEVIGMDVDPGSPQILADRLKSETEKWGELIKAANISLN